MPTPSQSSASNPPVYKYQTGNNSRKPTSGGSTSTVSDGRYKPSVSGGDRRDQPRSNTPIPPYRHGYTKGGDMSKSASATSKEMSAVVHSLELSTAKPPKDHREPRRRSIEHIAHEIEDLAGTRTVGSDVIDSIAAIREAYGERGASDVDRVFTDKSMTEHYRKRSTDPDFHKSELIVATNEVGYWKEDSRRTGAASSRMAARIDPHTRAGIQEHVGDLHEVTNSISTATRRLGDDFSGLSLEPRYTETAPYQYEHPHPTPQLDAASGSKSSSTSGYRPNMASSARYNYKGSANTSFASGNPQGRNQNMANAFNLASGSQASMSATARSKIKGSDNVPSTSISASTSGYKKPTVNPAPRRAK